MDSSANTNNPLTRKPGISSWMWHNIERLTTSSNFDKYGSSPPGSSGFFADFDEMHLPDIPASRENVASDFIVPSNTISKMTKMESAVDHSKKNESQYKAQCPDPHFPRSISTGSLTKHVAENFTGMIPSEDSTPMYTPEGSPSLARRAAPLSLEGLCGPTLQEHVEKKRSAAFFSSGSDALENQKKPKSSSPTMGYKKYAVTNFDMNVVSPISW